MYYPWISSDMKLFVDLGKTLNLSVCLLISIVISIKLVIWDTQGFRKVISLDFVM